MQNQQQQQQQQQQQRLLSAQPARLTVDAEGGRCEPA